MAGEMRDVITEIVITPHILLKESPLGRALEQGKFHRQVIAQGSGEGSTRIAVYQCFSGSVEGTDRLVRRSNATA
jgi:hypothetical protein